MPKKLEMQIHERLLLGNLPQSLAECLAQTSHENHNQSKPMNISAAPTNAGLIRKRGTFLSPETLDFKQSSRIKDRGGWNGSASLLFCRTWACAQTNEACTNENSTLIKDHKAGKPYKAYCFSHIAWVL